jgi:hypothetical protein
MKTLNRFGMLILLSIIGFAVFSSCTKKQFISSEGPVYDGKYDLAYPYGGDHKTLEKLLESVYLLNSSVYYESYTIPMEDQLKRVDIETDVWKKKNYPNVIINDFAVGTATIIYYKENRVAVLTCAHVVDFPDTIYTYYEVGKVTEDNVVNTVSFKKRQSNYVAGLPQGEDYEILVKDRRLDLAILGKKIHGTPSKSIQVFKYPIGAAKELNWGSLVYVVGFPSGKKMITTGVVSSPNRDQNHDFLLDALFNRGFSGGLVLAIRDGLPNFELVGLVNAVAADSEIFLVPRDVGDFSEFNFNIPYTGDIFAMPRKKINYGISYGISVEAIWSFLKRNRKELENAGYHFYGFFKPDAF